MFAKIQKRLVIEIGHYRALSEDVRRLLISYYLYLIAYPLFAVFTNAYLWRTGEDLRLLVIYNLFYCVGLPFGFYLNGFLLRWFHTLRLYAVGAFLEGLAGVLIVVFPAITSSTLVMYGLIAGFGAGLFWGNKNYLSLLLTKGSNRLYYNSLESAGDMIINMIVPAVAGVVISTSFVGSWYNTDTAYRILMFIALFLVGLAGYVVQSSAIKDIDREPVLLRHPGVVWRWVRIFNLLANIVVGAEFVIPSVLILVLVGHEGTLGLVNSVTAVLSALILYILGRKGEIKNIWNVYLIASIFFLISGAILAWQYSAVSVLVYMVASTVGWALRWPPAYSVVMETMDREGTSDGQYALICDNELMFNIGRSLGLGLVMAAVSVSQTTALRFIPLIVGMTSLLALIPLKVLIGRLGK